MTRVTVATDDPRHAERLVAAGALVEPDAAIRCPAGGAVVLGEVRVETADAPVLRAFGAGIAVLAGIADATNLLLAGKRVACLGFDEDGADIAGAARGFGANVLVCEPDAVAALRARAEGFVLATVVEACAWADVAIARADPGPEAIAALRDGAIVALGDDASLAARTSGLRDPRQGVVEHLLDDGRSVFAVALAPPAARDEALAALQVVVAAALADGSLTLQAGSHPVPASAEQVFAATILQ